MLVWFSYSQLFCTQLTKYLSLRSIDGHSSLFGATVPKGNVGGIELQAQHHLLFNTSRCSASHIAYYAGATHAVCTVNQQPWLVAVVLDNTLTDVDKIDNALITSHIVVAIHHTDSVYYIDAPPIPHQLPHQSPHQLPHQWRYARLVSTDNVSQQRENQIGHQKQCNSQLSDDSCMVELANHNIMDAITLLTTYTLSCQIMIFNPVIIERAIEHENRPIEDHTLLTQLHTHNNNVLDTITSLANQRYEQLAVV